MNEFEVQRCTRRCAKSGDELKPGATFFSVLVEEGPDVVRLDYAAEAWEGPPDESLGWWKSEMPSLAAKKMQWAPNDVMLEYFYQLADQADKEDMRYILTLLMIRRRLLRLEESESDDLGRELLVVFCARNEQEYKVPVVDPTEARIHEIQEELAQLLFAKAS